MSVNPQENPSVEKPNDKELNFRKLEQSFQAKLEEERRARLELEREKAELEKRMKSLPRDHEEDDFDDPYIDRRKLEKKLAQYDEKIQNTTKSQIQEAVQKALVEERRQNWLKSNPDFYDVMQYADKLAERDPDLADAIVAMPDPFERQRLAYRNIKALGLHKKEEPKPTMQQVVDEKRRSPFYQPTSIGSPPYQQSGDFSPTGQKSAYDKMKEMQQRLRLS